MAKLSSYLRDKQAVAVGDRIEVGPVGDRFGITLRGFTDEYRDAVWRLRRAAAFDLNKHHVPGDAYATPDSLPPTVDDVCQGKALADHCVMGVDGLQENDGSEMSLDRFKAILSAGDSPALINLTLQAMARVGRDAAEQFKVEAGN